MDGISPNGIDLVTLAAYVGLVAGLTSVLLEVLKAIAIDPYFPDSPQRTGVLRGLNFLMNLLFLCILLAGKGLFNWGDFLFYVAASLGLFTVSHTIQQTFSGSGPVAGVAARFTTPKTGSAAVSNSDAGGDIPSDGPTVATATATATLAPTTYQG